MDPDDHLAVELPSEFLTGSMSQLLDRVFPPDEEGQLRITDRFDLLDNPDLPDIYAVFLAVCNEWRDWRCALAASSGGEAVDLHGPAAAALQPGEDTRVLRLRLEQQYRALEYAVRHGLWASSDDLLSWMRSLVVLYFLDKHEVALAAPPPLSSGPALAAALRDLEVQGIISSLTRVDGNGYEDTDAAESVFVITPEGRRFISRLLDETESCIDQYDHYRDTLADPEGEMAEFATGRGADLRVEAFLAEGLDPMRTVFLLRLYDATLDSRLRDWVEALETEELFEGLLEPVVNRDSASPEAMAAVIEHGQTWLEERREQARRDEEDRDLLRQAGGGAP